MNREALSKISYGVYIICTGDEKYGNGYISNTVFQVTSSPAQFGTCCNKDNYSAGLIEKYGYFTVSVLHQNTDSEVYGRFGYKSGRDLDKFDGMTIKYGLSGTPIVLNDSVAYLELKVVQKIDVGTHWLFIGELVDAQLIDESLEPITYEYYRMVKKGLSPKNAPTYIDKTVEEPVAKIVENKDFKRYECMDCGYVYDESIEPIKFADLPDDWKCPICGAGKNEFLPF